MECKHYYFGCDISEAAEELSKLHTKQLLKRLRKTYGLRCNANEYGLCSKKQCNNCNAALEAYQCRLRKELATREHVLNKIEARKLRQEKAKGNRTRKEK